MNCQLDMVVIGTGWLCDRITTGHAGNRQLHCNVGVPSGMVPDYFQGKRPAFPDRSLAAGSSKVPGTRWHLPNGPSKIQRLGLLDSMQACKRARWQFKLHKMKKTIGIFRFQ